jgi:cysteine synthase A
MRFDTVLGAIGNTPHVRLNRLFAGSGHTVWMKLERQNPGYSIKDRIARAMVEDAEARGEIAPGRTLLVEPTSGNTGIGLAMVAAVKGYELVICMPESFSVERRRVMQAFGARLELTPREGGMKAGHRARRAARGGAGGRGGRRRPAGGVAPDAVREREQPRGPPPHHGAGGAPRLPRGARRDDHRRGHRRAHHRPRRAAARGVAEPQDLRVEPEKSPVISGGSHTPHRLQGIGAGFIPGNLHREVLDGVVRVSEEEAFDMARRCAREEGIFVGPSSGASLAAVAKTLPALPAGSRVLTFCYDTGDRYLSVEGLFTPPA